jgi:uncharacterized RDD family membrane protein YckC
MADGPSPSGPGRREPSLPGRLLGSGARGARRVAGVTGIDRAVEDATEEAIVAAMQSPAVERAIARVLRGPVVEEAMQDALDSAAVERALTDALDSEMVDRLWRRLLASDEAQQLVERIAQAPEVRSAIAAQGVGFLDDIRRELARAAQRLDGLVERIVRAFTFRPRRTEAPAQAGIVSRGLAAALDGLIVYGALAVASAALALFFNAIFGENDVPTAAILAGAGAWILISGAYLLVFWGLVGQTPGMRLVGLRLRTESGQLPTGHQTRVRLLWLLLSALPLGAGLLAILFDDRRRGWHDRRAGTEVVYTIGRDRAPAPWSEPAGQPATPAR